MSADGSRDALARARTNRERLVVVRRCTTRSSSDGWRRVADRESGGLSTSDAAAVLDAEVRAPLNGVTAAADGHARCDHSSASCATDALFGASSDRRSEGAVLRREGSRGGNDAPMDLRGASFGDLHDSRASVAEVGRRRGATGRAGNGRLDDPGVPILTDDDAIEMRDAGSCPLPVRSVTPTISSVVDALGRSAETEPDRDPRAQLPLRAPRTGTPEEQRAAAESAVNRAERSTAGGRPAAAAPRPEAATTPARTGADEADNEMSSDAHDRRDNDHEDRRDGLHVGRDSATEPLSAALPWLGRLPSDDLQLAAIRAGMRRRGEAGPALLGTPVNELLADLGPKPPGSPIARSLGQLIATTFSLATRPLGELLPGLGVAAGRPPHLTVETTRAANLLERGPLGSWAALAEVSCEMMQQHRGFGVRRVVDVATACVAAWAAGQGDQAATMNPGPGSLLHDEAPLAALPLRARSQHALARAGLRTIGDLRRASEETLDSLAAVSATTRADIVRALCDHNAALSTSASAQPEPNSADDGGGQPPKTADVPLSVLWLTVRSRNALRNAGVETVGQLRAMTSEQLLSIRNLGAGSLGDIERALAAHASERGFRFEGSLSPHAMSASPPSSAQRGQRQRESRLREMTEMRAQGMTLREIGEQFGVTEGRVSQLLKGINVASARETRAQRANAAALARCVEIVHEYRKGRTPSAIAGELNLRGSAVEWVLERELTDRDRAMHRLKRAQAREDASRIYSDGDLLDAVRSVAAELGSVPSSTSYARHARQRRLPSLQTLRTRFGSWSTAIEAAGMTPRPPRRAGFARRWTAEACWQALRKLVATGDATLSAREYERLYLESDELPSLDTIRNRLGRWDVVAARLMLENGQPRLARCDSPPEPPRGEAGDRTWTAEECWRALRTLMIDRDVPPRAPMYARLAAADNELPSIETVRDRLGRWDAIAKRLMRASE
jgi:Bacterial RNA polymerase, alpha chain C terminal domain/Homing endonuclease associated repeat/Sigma-70, region 4